MTEITPTTTTRNEIKAMRRIVLTENETFEFLKNRESLFNFTVPTGKTLKLVVSIVGNLE